METGLHSSDMKQTITAIRSQAFLSPKQAMLRWLWLVPAGLSWNSTQVSIVTLCNYSLKVIKVTFLVPGLRLQLKCPRANKGESLGDYVLTSYSVEFTVPGLSNHETSNYFSNYQDAVPSSTLLLDLGKWSANGLFNFYEDFNKT